MWDLIVSVPDHCLSFYFVFIFPEKLPCFGSIFIQFPREITIVWKHLYSSSRRNYLAFKIYVSVFPEKLP